MANALYDRGRQGFLAGDIDWDTDNIRCHLIDEGVDVPDLALDEDMADRTAGAIEATSSNITSPTVVDGTADAADVTWSAVASGPSVESIDIAMNTGVTANDLMICNIDTATGLPVTPNGGDITAQWDSGADAIFTL